MLQSRYWLLHLTDIAGDFLTWPLKGQSCCSPEWACEGEEALRRPLPLLPDPGHREPVREEAPQEVPGGQVGPLGRVVDDRAHHRVGIKVILASIVQN